MKNIVFYVDIRAVEAAAKAVGSLNSRGIASFAVFTHPTSKTLLKP